MAERQLTFPTTEDEIRKLRAGDLVTVDGHIIGIRDRTQMRIFDEGVEPPMDLNGAFLLHTAPNVRKLGPGKYEPMCVGTKNPDQHVAKLEEELYELLNETGIGPMGLGGDVTVLQCHIEHADTHMTLNPVAVNYQCWAARRASAHVTPDGEVEYDREF